MITSDALEAAMRHALSLAAHGPTHGGNPQVGCVLLDENGAIVAEGWHRGAGTPHAEVDALAKVPDASGLTAVVTLEPCNHTGRTGPCATALIDAGVSRVVYAVADPGNESSGGAARLRAAGIEVESGVLAEDAEQFLHPWLTSMRLGRPYVIAKWASTLDGRAAAADGTSQWITGTAARQRVHEQREQADAILVGTGTVLTDDPALTARGDAGELMEHQPIPVVIGERRIPATARLRQHPRGVIETSSRDLNAVLDDLNSRGIRRLFIEGGPTLTSRFIESGLVDEYLVYLAPALLGAGQPAVGEIGVETIGDARRLTIHRVDQVGEDLLITARPKEGQP